MGIKESPVDRPAQLQVVQWVQGWCQGRWVDTAESDAASCILVARQNPREESGPRADAGQDGWSHTIACRQTV